jgi:hypothetical protein
MPYTPLTAPNLKKLADRKPKTLAIMHGSSFTGDCARALDDFNAVLREVFGRQTQRRNSPIKAFLVELARVLVCSEELIQVRR